MPPDRAAVAAIFETARTHTITRKGKIERPYAAHHDFIVFLARTGVRLGEALAIRWGDVDFVRASTQSGSQQCGHASPGFTLDVYGHLFPDAVRQNVDRLDDAGSVPVARPDAPRRTQPRKRNSP